MVASARASAYGALHLDANEDVETGTRSPARARKGTLTRLVIGMMVGAVCAAAVVRISSGMVETRQEVASVVDANRDRLARAPVPGVMEKSAEVANITSFGLRWVIFGFTTQRDQIIPLMQGRATDDWEKDFITFKNALPKNDVAGGLYNFEYWDDDESRETKVVLVSWRPESVTDREEARAGFYLGSLMVATDDYVEEHYPMTTMHDNYFEFCSQTMGIPIKQCALDKRFHNCPFNTGNDEDSNLPHDNPCVMESCQGSTFQDPNAALDGAIPQACCDYIVEDFCMDAENMANHGCHPTTVAAITKLCELPPIPEVPELLVTPEEEQLCLDDCANSCRTFDDPNDTWKKCSACPIDGLAHDLDGDGPNPALVYQCHSDALGFEMERCCGIAPECGAPDAQADFMCGALEYFECGWVDHRDCPELKVSQVRAASAVGCCQTTGKEDGAVAYEEEIHEVDCGGDFTSDEDKAAMDFVLHPDMSCQQVQDDIAAAIAAAEDEAAAAAAGPITTTEPVAVRRMAEERAQANERYAEFFSDKRSVRYSDPRRIF